MFQPSECLPTPARRRRRHRRAGVVVVVATLALVAGCARGIAGSGHPAVPDAELTVQGDSGDALDTQVKNALSDVTTFWQSAYPSVSGGRQLPPLRGKLYSVDGQQVIATKQAPQSAAEEGCLRQELGFIIDNAAYCTVDDSVIWDRAPHHLLSVLSAAYGPDLTFLVFAHEFGHAIQTRLHVDDAAHRTIDLEQQADCAAGAFARWAFDGKAAHIHLTAASLDNAINGFLQVRDSTPQTPADVTHGNGFDRVNALQQGFNRGVTYCFGPTFFDNRSYTERGYVRQSDYAQGGNEPLDKLVSAGELPKDLNRFWTGAGKTVGRTLSPVKLTEAGHPPCGGSTPGVQFGYCPAQNTVYYSTAFAERAYNSLAYLDVNENTAVATMKYDQPADFALGELISIAWGMAARQQFFHGSLDDRAGLLAAVCYSGAYADDINLENPDATHSYLLSPPDMDEATSAVMNLVQVAFGERGTTGLQRVSSFVKGYNQGLSAC